MRDVVGHDESTLSVCDSCGGVWMDGADLNRLLLHNDLPGLESMGGKANLDELSDRCPKDQVDLIIIEGGEKSDPKVYACCEACGGIWLPLEAPEEADAELVEELVVGFFREFRRPGAGRSVRT